MVLHPVIIVLLILALNFVIFLLGAEFGDFLVLTVILLYMEFRIKRKKNNLDAMKFG